MTLLYVWILLFGFVGTQLAWTLRPFFGSPGQDFALFREHRRQLLRGDHPDHRQPLLSVGLPRGSAAWLLAGGGYGRAGPRRAFGSGRGIDGSSGSPSTRSRRRHDRGGAVRPYPRVRIRGDRPGRRRRRPGRGPAAGLARPPTTSRRPARRRAVHPRGDRLRRGGRWSPSACCSTARCRWPSPPTSRYRKLALGSVRATARLGRPARRGDRRVRRRHPAGVPGAGRDRHRGRRGDRRDDRGLDAAPSG